MQPIRETIHHPDDWDRVKKSLPKSFRGRDLEVIIMPETEATSDTETKKRSGLFGSLNKYANPAKIKDESKAWPESIRDE